MKKILCVTLAVAMLLLSVLSVSAGVGTDATPTYEEIILEKLNPPYTDPYQYEYKELYSYHSSPATADEATPDYVLVFMNTGDFGPAYSCGVFGDYVVRERNVYYPYELGYYVYRPAEDELYTLREAWNENPEEINQAFIDGALGELIGDVDKDNVLSVKDATKIQKCIARIEDFDSEDEISGYTDDETETCDYISDFNRDGVRNIKDATAIQKHIAGLEY